MFQISNLWILFLMDVSTKSVLLVIVAGIALKSLKLRDSNIRHRVWSGVLAGMLLLPFLTLALPAIPLSIPASWAQAGSTRDGGPTETQQVANTQASSLVQTENTPNPNPNDTETPLTSQTSDTQHSGAIGATDTGRRGTIAEPATVSPGSIQRTISSLPSTLFVFWMSVSLLFALRLATGLWVSSRMRRRSANLGGVLSIQKCLSELPTTLSQRAPTICESTEIRVPVTVGWLRPAVLLPTEWQSWTHEKLSAIIAHEVTHVARRDFFVAVAAELNRCLYWFHPVSWWLRSRLSDLAEEACDDAAIGQTGDRTGYARHLLEVATSLATGTGRRVQPGLSMARESNVESRIATILDFKRPLSKHMSWRSGSLIALIAIPVIASAAIVRPVSLTIPTEEPGAPIAALDEGTVGATPKSVRVHGQVTDTEGRPLPQSRVRLYRTQPASWYAARDTSTLIVELKVDSEGRFDQRVAANRLPPKAKAHGDNAVLVVSAPNHAYAALSGDSAFRAVDPKVKKKPDFLKQAVTVQLKPEVTIRGRVLSIEGRPVVGATVSIFQVGRPYKARLDAWIKQTGKSPSSQSGRRAAMYGVPVSAETFFPAERLQLPSDFIQPVVTDSSGSFQIAGLAASDDLVVLRIKGAGTTDTTVHVLARDMKTIYGRHTTKFSFAGAYYGRDFDFVAQPSVPIFGVVRDIETKEPLANIPVAVGGVYGSTMSHRGYIVTKTDDQGRYRIEGLPIPPKGTRQYERNNLSVRPGNLPYIENDNIPIPRGDGVNPVEFNVELRRAVVAKGRLTDASGKPVVADFFYAPFLTNENNKNFLKYADGLTSMLGNDTRYRSDENGYFSIPVIPGRGVIAARVKSGGFINGFGAGAIKEFAGEQGIRLGRTTSDHIVPTRYHSLKEIDVSTDATEFELTMHVDPGSSIVVRFVDPKGNPLKRVGGRGVSAYRDWTRFEEDHATANGLAVGAIRPMFLALEDQSLTRYVRLIPKEGQKEFTVTLYPSSRLTGRILDPQGRPLPNTNIETRHSNDPSMGGSRPAVRTDKDGRFEVPLPVGTSYTVLALADKYFRVTEKLENSEPKNIDLGDLVLDPDAEAWTQVTVKSKPIVSEISQ